jgi:hypothetical protein
MIRRMVIPRRGERPAPGLLSVVSLLLMLDAGRAAHADPIARGRTRDSSTALLLSTEAQAQTVHRDFEAVALQALLAPMLTHDRSSAYGAGAAGKHWQAMLTEHIAKQMAASGRLRLSAPSRPARPRLQAAPPAMGAVRTTHSPCHDRACAKGQPWTTTVVVASDDAEAEPETNGWQTRIIDATAPACTQS